MTFIAYDLLISHNGIHINIKIRSSLKVHIEPSITPTFKLVISWS